MRSGRTSFVAHAVQVLTGNTLVLALTFVNGVLIARGLGPEGQGTVSALLVLPVLFTTIAEMGIRQATMRAVAAARAADAEVIGVVSAMLLLSSLLGVVLCGALLWLQRRAGSDAWLIALALLFIPAKLATSFGSGFLLGKNQIRDFSRLSWSGEAARTFFLVVLVWIAHLGVRGAMLATWAGAALVAVTTGALISRYGPLRLRWNAALARSLVAAGTIYAISLLVLQLNYQGHVILLTRMSTMKEVGIFSLAANLAMMLWQLPNAAGIVIFARSAAAPDPRAFSVNVARAVRVALALVFGAAVVLYALAGIFIRWVFGAAYAESASVLRMMLPGIVAFTVFRVMNMDLAGRGKPHLALYSAVPALLVATALNVTLIPRMGAQASALASSLGLTLAAVVMSVVYSRETGLPLGEILRFRLNDFPSFRSPEMKVR